MFALGWSGRGRANKVRFWMMLHHSLHVCILLMVQHLSTIPRRPLGLVCPPVDLSDVALNLGAAANQQVVGLLEELRFPPSLRDAYELEQFLQLYDTEFRQISL